MSDAPIGGWPAWLLQLVAAVQQYEEIHSHPKEGGFCLGDPLLKVPASVQEQARGYAQAKREAADAT